MAGKAVDIRLIPEFHAFSSDHTVSEWLEQVELACEMCGVDNIEHVLPERWGSVSIPTVNPQPEGGFTAGKTSPPPGFCARPFCCI